MDLKEEAKRKAEDAVARFEEENNNKNKNDVVVPPNDEGRRNKKRRRNNGDGGESRRTVQTLDDDDDEEEEDPGDDDDDDKTAAARGGRRQRGGGKTRGSRGGGGGSKGGSKEDATKEKGDDEGQPEYECMYSVPCPGNEGRIIGKRGQKIRELQAKYGVVMQMNREKVTVEIMGDRDKVRECEAEVVKIIEDGNVRNMEKEQRQQHHHQQRGGGGGGGGGGGRREENRGTNHQKEEIPCSGMEGRIIGRGGETIHRLEAESGARVRINRDRLVCEISGEPGRVQTAVRMVHELMARGDSRTRRRRAINKGGNKAFTDKLTVNNNNNNNNNNNSVNQRPLLKCTARHPRTVSRLHLTPLPFMVNNPKRTVPDKFTVKKRPLRPLLFTDNKYTVLLKHKCNASPHPRRLLHPYPPIGKKSTKADKFTTGTLERI